MLELRDSALDLETAYDRIVGNIDFRDQFTRVRSWEDGRLHVELWSPHYSTSIDRGEQQPMTNIANAGFAGEVKLKLGWDGDRLNLMRCEPGDWEALVA